MCFEMCKEVGACPQPAGENVDCNCFACSGFDTAAYESAKDGGVLLSSRALCRATSAAQPARGGP